MTIQIEHMTSAQFKPREVRYVDVNHMHPIYDGLFKNTNEPKPLVLVGPKGTGKSLSIASYAHKTETPVITFDCSEDVRRSQLIGMFILRGQETPFVLGPLTTAFEIANECGKCIVILEEVNALTPQMQKLLNGVCDFRRRIEVPECKKVFELKPNCKLWITGTMNTAVYGGVYALNEDLKSRLRLMNCSYPIPSEEKKILVEALNGTGSKLDPKTIDKVLLLAHETRQNAMDYAFSTRDVVQVLEDVAVLGEEKALRLSLGKFDGDDRSTVKARIESIFAGVKIEG